MTVRTISVSDKTYITVITALHASRNEAIRNGSAGIAGEIDAALTDLGYRRPPTVTAALATRTPPTHPQRQPSLIHRLLHPYATAARRS